MLKLGVHTSAAGKIYDSVTRAKKIGCNTFQIFARSPRKFRRKTLPARDIELFKQKVKREKISPVVIHIPYTLNLASAKERFYKITIKEFIVDLLEAGALGADYLVTHMGSYKGTSEENGLLKVGEALKIILNETKGVKTKVLLENTSGSGRWLGYNFSHHRIVFDITGWPAGLGVCLDTAHAFAAGYNLAQKHGLDSLVGEIKEQVGLDRLKLIHLNDTQEKLGSRHDRHYDIGQGNIGEKGFELILSHPAFKKIPFILETPKKNQKDDADNLEAVRRIYKKQENNYGI